ncbi:enoyl-CoA hydratase/isomerase family protein [Streptomyces sp. AC536]|uniref:enoyl-CoA hydratase/isomerase family protein n=1 Tax=Streptomyces buecherae TaxID=2763006 RepID=UPI00164EBEFB|nr:enoyl-CoA hydratase/isomerase family protein [Streptomyces buecherae]MBC3986560.1 enoyl-CoA hydratase/isomerase family protein [Streptomyces buecherae]QNJ43836.1 enoyl-CoA hydratase/isomerase family protein [Streptomyces buecherae]
MNHSPAAEDVLTRVRGRSATLTLNRPKALNSLSHAMVRALDAALTAWEHDDAVRTVVIEGAGERGLCAGGDIRAIYEDARAGGTASRAFWRDEYVLNAHIARYPKPYVALMDGIVMGGGVGVSAHGGVRVVTERSTVAMPEVGIGFVPDVGGTHLLASAPGELGTHLALTTDRMAAGGAIACGFADHFVPAERLDAFKAALETDTPAEAVDRFAAPTPASEWDEHREWIDACYAADSVEEILTRLRDCGVPAAKEAAERVAGKSPTALKVTLSALRRARRLGALEPVLDQEYRVSCAALTTPDLVEGVRAQVVDKDRRPRWSPAHLAEVSPADVERFFADLGPEELGLAARP